MSQTLELPQAPVQTVRAGVHEKNLFSTLGHLFAGSFSTIGELMQNARRAGASRVEFEFDPVAASLVVSDDGHGIRDFSALIQLCESAWDEQVTLTDRPYGMGLFSVLFAAKEITFRSNSRRLALRLQDVVEKRPLQVLSDPYAPERGTRIELVGLAPALVEQWPTMRMPAEGLAQVRHYRLVREIVRRAMGFPIPVTLNGVELERPHAQAALAGEMTPIGFVSIRSIHSSPGHAIGEVQGRHTMATYLQGLPIGDTDAQKAGTIVHLDGQAFTAQMPDRARLYDAEKASLRIHEELTQLAREYLARQKASLSGQDFVLRHWGDCERFCVRHLLNDIPWVPRSELGQVDSITEDAEDAVFGLFMVGADSGDLVEDQLVSRDQIVSGQLKLWRGIPDRPSDSRVAALVLKLAQRERIGSIEQSLDPGHWLCAITPHVDDLDFHVQPVNPRASTTFYSGDWVQDITMQLVDRVEVNVFSKVDPTFELHLTIQDDWVLLPEDYATEGLDTTIGCGSRDSNGICFIAGSGAGSDHPVDSLSSYRDDSEVYRDEWRDRDVEQWDAAQLSLRGDSVAIVVRRSLGSASARPGLSQLQHIAIVRATRRRLPDGELRDPTFSVVDPQRDGFWQEVAQQLLAQGVSGEQAQLAEQIKTAFFAVVKPGELTDN